MKWIDVIKEQIPMEQIQALLNNAKIKMVTTTVKKDDPNLADAEKVMRRIHYLVSEQSSIELGKQEIFKREVKNEDGTTKIYTYMVDFNKPEQIKRLRTVLLELADLSSPDSSKAKKESIPGYLDYIAEAGA